MSQKIQYAILLIPYEGDAVIHSELCPTESEVYEYAHDIIKTENGYIKDFSVFAVKERQVEYTQTLVSHTEYYDTYRVYNAESKFVGFFEYHSKDAKVENNNLIPIVKPRAERFYIARKDLKTEYKYYTELEKKEMIKYLLEVEEEQNV